MTGITHRSTRKPLLKTTFLSHGTLESRNLPATRRFYEEVLGLEVVQQALNALMVRLGSNHCYAVVETPTNEQEMSMLNHNGIDMGSEEEVREAYEILQTVKDDYGIKKLTKPLRQHGTFSFYLHDLDGNWWEICHLPAGGYDFRFNENVDLSGRDDLTPEEIQSRFFRPEDHTSPTSN
ncbi:VOC family protein [Nocardia sp. NPDC003183]